MKRRDFVEKTTLASLAIPLSMNTTELSNQSKADNLTLVRHATLLIRYHGLKLLVDPMLSAKGELRAISSAKVVTKNPLVDLKVPMEEIIRDTDAVFLTHLHFDHFDDAAKSSIPKGTKIFCQEGDADKIKESGFTQVEEIVDSVNWSGIKISRTGGVHGTGEIGQRMGKVSGFVLTNEKSPTVYIAGDTIWHEDVERAIDIHQPDIIVLNAGAATFLEGDPITMTSEDVAQVYAAAPGATIYPVHMESINHCELKRPALEAYLNDKNMNDRVKILTDGESISLT